MMSGVMHAFKTRLAAAAAVPQRAHHLIHGSIHANKLTGSLHRRPRSLSAEQRTGVGVIFKAMSTGMRRRGQQVGVLCVGRCACVFIDACAIERTDAGGCLGAALGLCPYPSSFKSAKPIINDSAARRAGRGGMKGTTGTAK